MKQEQKHAALPNLSFSEGRTHDETNSDLNFVLLSDRFCTPKEGKRIKFVGLIKDKESAEFIVRACNSHYELLEALQLIANTLVLPSMKGIATSPTVLKELRQKAMQAITKAKGGQDA